MPVRASCIQIFRHGKERKENLFSFRAFSIAHRKGNDVFASNGHGIANVQEKPLLTNNLNLSVIKKVAFLGDYLPRKCGIATFTTDLRSAVAMHKLDIFSLQRRCVRTDVECLRFPIRHHHIKRELPLGLGKRFPCLADVIGLLLCGHLGRQPRDHRCDFQLTCRLH